MRQRQQQAGGVSIFVVIFSALLVTIVTVSFVSVMIRSQQQATNADLSNSAYDSALAGVEDAKRLLLTYRTCLRTGDTGTACTNSSNAINSKKCNTVKKGLYGQSDPNPEVLIQRQVGDDVSGDLNQAYTCVTIEYTSPSGFQGTLTDGQSQLIALESVPANSFNQVKVSWFLKEAGSTDSLDLPTDTTFPKHTTANWSSTTPPVLRTQLIQMADTFSSSQFDQDDSGKSNTNTVFLLPYNAGLSSALTPADYDNRTNINAPKSPYPVKCRNSNYQANEYACEKIITLPTPIGGARQSFFMQLGAIYNKTDYKIELLNNGVPVSIVAPIVDSTGRANDLFRRVSAQINFASSDYPQPELYINGDLCKNFSVTTRESDYKPDSTCTP